MKNKEVQELYDNVLFFIEALVTYPELKENELREMGIDLAFQAIFSSSGTSFEAIGMIEKVKDVYKERHYEMLERLEKERLEKETEQD